MAARTKYWHLLQTSKQEALLAVDLYNRPATSRLLEAHIVHMHLAWLYLAQAIFTRDGRDYRRWERDPKTGRQRLRRTKDGDVETWDLARSIRELQPNENDPVRRNIEFFIELRNKIEHRHANVIEAIVAGRIQANVLSFEQRLVAEFGKQEGLGRQLRLPIFLSTLTEDASAAVRRAHQLLPARVRRYIEEHESELPDDVRNHPSYELRVYLIPKIASEATADAAIEFVNVADLTEEQRRRLQEVQVVIRDRLIPAANLGRYRPRAVARAVQLGIPWKFAESSGHARA